MHVSEYTETGNERLGSFIILLSAWWIIWTFTFLKALNDLDQNFPADIKPFVEFLRSIREVHTVCMKEELDLSFVYKEAIEKFEKNRKFLYEVFGLNHTLKMHIIRDHFWLISN